MLYLYVLLVVRLHLCAKCMLVDTIVHSQSCELYAVRIIDLLLYYLFILFSIFLVQDENDRCLSVQLFQASVAKDSTDGKVSL